MEKTEDYEKREEKAISDGKNALKKIDWLFERTNQKSKGFFFELKENKWVHPNYYAIHCVDGVGTKLFFSAWSNNYTLAMIDAIAMNANDLATSIHAFPECVDLYFAVQRGIEEQHMGEIMAGLTNAMEMINIPCAPFKPNIGKIETASLDEMISLGVPGKGWDVGVVMTGFIEKDRVPNLDPRPGDIIIGVSSTGLHSNGYTNARHVLLDPYIEKREEWKNQYTGRFKLADKPAMLEGKTILEALQQPTAIYLCEAAHIGHTFFENNDIYGVNITGNGLHNFNRTGKNVSFEITDPFDPTPIHMLLIQESKMTPREAYKKHNMGMGFAYIVPTLEIAEIIVDYINKRGNNTAKIVGEVKERKDEELKTVLHKPYEGKPLEFAGYNN